MSSESLEKLYSIFRWPEDPFSDAGRARYERILEEMEQLCDHKWVKELLEVNNKLRVLDICGGAGLAGVALSKGIADLGKEHSLTILDLRPNALDKARQLGVKELGREPETLLMNAVDVGKVNRRFDLALIWGSTTPHFNPWEMTKILAGASIVLDEDGILVIEEADRVYSIFTQRGYQRVLVENLSEDMVVVSFHSGYDVKTGMFKRLTMDLVSGSRTTSESHFWGIADTAQAAWTFFKDVDLMLIERTRAFIIAHKPRRTIDPLEFIASEPSLLGKESSSVGRFDSRW